MFLFCFLYIYHHRLVKYLIQHFLNLQFSPNSFIFFDSFSLSTRKDTNLFIYFFSSPSLTLNVLTHPLILGIIKTNGLKALFEYPIKYLQLVFI